jgi:hypothetical protein
VGAAKKEKGKMPGRDGTGPQGSGPMTGSGAGVCILKTDPHVPGKAVGFAGVSGKPVVVSIPQSRNKEVVKMPRGDGTGPAGMGSMTGRAAGYCAGYPVPGFMNFGQGCGVGFGWGRGYGFGRGMQRGFRSGRGWGGGYWGNAYPPVVSHYPTAVPPYAAVPYGGVPQAWQAGPTAEQEADMLKGQAEYFEDALASIRKRIAELEAKAENK